MPEKRRRLLKAIEHNWGLVGAGTWSETIWNIFYDGSYEVISAYIPYPFSIFDTCEDMMNRNERPKRVEKKTTGI